MGLARNDRRIWVVVSNYVRDVGLDPIDYGERQRSWFIANNSHASGGRYHGSGIIDYFNASSIGPKSAPCMLAMCK